MKYEEFKIFAGKIFTSLSRDFCTENPNSKMFLTRTFLFVNQFSKFLLHIFDKLNSQLSQENISSRFKQLQNICKKPLSDTRKCTLNKGTVFFK